MEAPILCAGKRAGATLILNWKFKLNGRQSVVVQYNDLDPRYATHVQRPTKCWFVCTLATAHDRERRLGQVNIPLVVLTLLRAMSGAQKLTNASP